MSEDAAEKAPANGEQDHGEQATAAQQQAKTQPAEKTAAREGPSAAKPADAPATSESVWAENAYYERRAEREEEEAAQRDGEEPAEKEDSTQLADQSEGEQLTEDGQWEQYVADLESMGQDPGFVTSSNLSVEEGEYAMVGGDDGIGLLLPLLGLVAVGVGIALIADGDDDDDDDFVNTAPTLTVDDAVDVDENTDAGEVVVDADADDAEGDGVEFSLTGDDADQFTIDTDDGEVRFNQSPDFETQDTFNITVVATDDFGATASQDVVVTVNDMDESPVFGNQDTTFTVAENTVINTVLFDPMVVDVEGDDVTLTLTGEDADFFSVDEQTQEIVFEQSPDFETDDTLTFSVVASDGQGNQTTQDITVNVTDVEDDDFENQFGLVASRLTGEDAFEDADRFFTTTFTPLNNSGASGIALIGFDDDTDTLTVSIQASGLEANQLHPQHIHGFEADGDGNVQDAVIPTLDNDDDGDGFIEVSEGAAAYGPILLDLMSGGNFPTADANGNVSFTQSYSLPEQDLGADPMLGLREIVLHGLSLMEGEGSNGGQADGTAGYKAALPVAAGELGVVNTGNAFATIALINAFSPDGQDFEDQFGQIASAITGESEFAEGEAFFITSLTELNDSGVTGVVLASFDEDTGNLTVTVQARGLEADQLHPQHIHGFMADGDGNVQDAVIPTLDNDDDGDGFIEVSEGAAAYGPILLDLDDGTDFPTADANGVISFTQTYSLPEQDLGEDPMIALREFVIHGLSLMEGDGANGGQADGTAGYKAALPVGAGEFDQVMAATSFDALVALDAFTPPSVIA